MPTPFDDAISLAQASIAGVAGRTIVYRRGEQSTTIADVVVGQSRFEVVDASGFQTQEVVRDYLAPASALADLDPAEPKEGDRIEDTDGDEVRVYAVLPPSGNEPAWRHRDAARTQLRIHTKHVA